MHRQRHPVLALFVVTLLLTASYEEATAAGPRRACDEASSIEIRDGNLLKNGSLLTADGLLFPPGLFWDTFSSENGSLVARGCVCMLKSCIRKCCPHGHVYNYYNHEFTCESKHNPAVRESLTNVTSVQDAEEFSKHHMLFGHMCGENGMFPIDPHEIYHLDEKGDWHYSDTQSNATFSVTADEFCVEVVALNGMARVATMQCASPQPEPEEKHWTYLVFPVGMVISEPFLIATIFVYGIVPELRNIHGKNLMSHCTSIFIAYFFLAIVQFGIVDSDVFCVTAAFIIQFSFLASFFWLNIMCFDLWWTFSGCRPMRGSVRERDHKKFIIYSMYSWGCPLIILVVTMIMDLSPNISNEYAKPQFGDGRCWFEKDNVSAMWAYFYGPVAIILTANMLMFITTAVKIVKLKKETAMLQTSTESKRHDDEENSQRFSLYLKLFVVMGVNWVMEVISWAVGGPEYIWFVTDMGNTLQGVLIFIIFVWKDKVRKLLRKRFSDSADSKSQQYSTASKSTRVFSSTRSSLRNTSANTSQNDFNMSPVARNA